MLHNNRLMSLNGDLISQYLAPSFEKKDIPVPFNLFRETLAQLGELNKFYERCITELEISYNECYIKVN